MIKPIVLGALALTFTVAGAIVHGQVRHRWGLNEELQRRMAALAGIPSQIGVWEIKGNDQELDPAVKTLLECDDGYLRRTYANRETGAVVEVFLVVGPAGPIAVHTPAVCYRAGAFRVGEQTELFVGDHAINLLSMAKPDVTKYRMHVAYAWRHGETWEVSDSPRFRFAFHPYLYKIQTAAQGVVLPDGSEDHSVTQSFLEAFLPELERTAFTTK
ncbi:MAG: exosortase-associated EpsI family protein [Planctomycetales bacterium]|nr:exosortase-associated EpsI family protein [Planctomycetales bacterium]